MTTAVITWDLQTPSASQLPIDYVLPEVSADAGVNWAPLPVVPAADPQTTSIADIPGGDWLVRLTVYDTDGTPSNGVTEPFVVPFEGPSDVVNVQVSFV